MSASSRGLLIRAASFGLGSMAKLRNMRGRSLGPSAIASEAAELRGLSRAVRNFKELRANEAPAALKTCLVYCRLGGFKPYLSLESIPAKRKSSFVVRIAKKTVENPGRGSGHAPFYLLGCSCCVSPLICLAGNLAIKPTTTLAAQASNNTSATNSFVNHSNGNLGAGHISKVNTRSLLYPGARTKIYAHLVLWFGQSNHMNVGYTSSDPAQDLVWPQQRDRQGSAACDA